MSVKHQDLQMFCVIFSVIYISNFQPRGQVAENLN